MRAQFKAKTTTKVGQLRDIVSKLPPAQLTYRDIKNLPDVKKLKVADNQIYAVLRGIRKTAPIVVDTNDIQIVIRAIKQVGSMERFNSALSIITSAKGIQ